MQDLDLKFQDIKSEYSRFEQKLKQSGKGLVYRTQKGIYGTTNLDNIFAFFRQIGLQNYDHFLDLGCGDGRVVLVASLFTKATGIEYTEELIGIAKAIQHSLNIDCGFICGDFLEHDLSGYDVIFINPDHEFGDLDTKLKKELKGPLFVYNEIFAPYLLKKGKKYWFGQLPIVKYTND